jgi:dUTP pyrophosphatase
MNTTEERPYKDTYINLIKKFERWDTDNGVLRYTVDEGCPISLPIKPPAYEGDIGFDLGAAIEEPSMVVPPHGFVDVPTFVRIELPKRTWGDIRPRSSTFAKRRLVVMGGTIDNGYRGLLSVFIYNPNPTPVTFDRGDYLAQLVIMHSVVPSMKLEDILPESQRGQAGFGSSGGFGHKAQNGNT